MVYRYRIERRIFIAFWNGECENGVYNFQSVSKSDLQNCGMLMMANFGFIASNTITILTSDKEFVRYWPQTRNSVDIDLRQKIQSILTSDKEFGPYYIFDSWILRYTCEFLPHCIEFYLSILQIIVRHLRLFLLYNRIFLVACERAICAGMRHPANVATCARMALCPISFEIHNSIHLNSFIYCAKEYFLSFKKYIAKTYAICTEFHIN
jgi:hypothetical protein